MIRHASRCCLVAFVLLSCAAALAAATAPLAAVHWDDANQRWRDVATNPFAAAKKTDFSYEQANVTITYDDSAGTFRGTIVATNLKPNFAYQIKLNGKPTHTWGADGDDWANEQLGYNGRWWVDEYDSSGGWVSGWNSADTEYAYWKERNFTDGSNVYVFQGYLLFENLVTDAAGKATKSFSLDSSFHVLWKTSQRTRKANDSTAATYTISATTANAWYSQNYATTKVSLYAEWEPGRPLPGKVRLPNGEYNVRLFLTEESFHETAAGSGSWATVMCDDFLAFSVKQSPPTLASVTAANAKSNGRYSISATVNNPGPAASLTLKCVVAGAGGQQTLQQKTVNVPAAGTAKVTWTDAVGSSMKAGTYTATVTIVQTGESKASNAFTVSRR